MPGKNNNAKTANVAKTTNMAKGTVSKIRRDKLMHDSLDVVYLASRGKSVLFKIVFYFMVIGLCFSILYPIIKILPVVFSDFSVLDNPDAIWLPLQASTLSFQAAIRFSFGNGSGLLLTLLYCFAIAIIQIIMSAMAGYSLGRVQSKLHGIIMLLVILTIVVPPQSLLISQYLSFKSFDILGIFKLLTGSSVDLINKPYTLFLLAVTGFGVKQSIFIFIFRQFFKGLPMELEEAALIDGCGYYKTFFRIAFPNAIPSILTVGTLSVVWNYADTYLTGYFHPDGPYIANTLSRQFAPQNMETVLFAMQRWFGVAQTTGSVFDAVKYASALLYLLPLLVFYFVLQKRLVENFENSGIVG